MCLAWDFQQQSFKITTSRNSYNFFAICSGFYCYLYPLNGYVYLSTTDDAVNCKAVFIHNESKSTEVEASLSADDKWWRT